jgi:hypothetical protein
MNIKKHLRILIISTGLLTLSCGKHDDNLPPLEVKQSEAPLFANASVNCATQASCSPSVGMLVIDMSPGKGTCTAFLTDDGVLVTNDHCVPHDLSEGASCNERIEVLFPVAGGYDREQIRCDKILWRSRDSSDNNPLTIDTAYLKLSRVPNRPKLHFSHDGVEQHEMVKIFNVDPDHSRNGSISGTLRTKTCRVVQKSSLFPSLDGHSSLGFILASPRGDTCEIISGNSGSPVVGSDGEVKGIVHHSNRAGDSGSILEQFSRAFSTTQTGIMKPFAVATNFSCVKSPTENAYASPIECINSVSPAYQSEKTEEMRKASHDNQLNKLNELAEKWGNENYPMFTWKMGAIKTGLIFQKDVLLPIPFCTKNVGLNERAYQGRFWGHKNWFEAKQIIVPHYSPNFTGLDDDFNTNFEVTRSDDYYTQYNFGFSPDSIAHNKPTIVRLSEVGIIMDSKLIDEPVNPCTK